jgi:hypothetical protein
MNRSSNISSSSAGPVSGQPSRAMTQPPHRLAGAHKLGALYSLRRAPHPPVGPFRCARFGKDRVLAR